MEVKDLKPAIVWQFFDRITKIPRPSKDEGKIVKFLEDFAKENGLEIRKDKANNVLISKPATAGRENQKTVILQSHLDMVCEKNKNVEFNFYTDPIQTYVESGLVKARGTTLGADDGIGVAVSLSLLASKDVEHGPLECLFTTDEESGLTGAYALDRDFLSGGDILINLDSEKWGEFCIGCAGGRNTIGVFKYKQSAVPENYFWFEVKVEGLKGGHSGCDIHLGRGNANKIITRYLRTLSKDNPLVLAKIDGGNLHNAIAREANATAGIPQADREKAVIMLNILQAEVSAELAKPDGGVTLTINTVPAPESSIDAETTRNLLDTLCAMPHGVAGMSHDIEGLVETSTNMASVKMTGGNTITVVTSQRSSTVTLLTDICNQVEATFELGAAAVIQSDGYPAWKPNVGSEILKTAKLVFEKQYGESPEVIAIHAGLECGLFLEKNPGLDMISCGPTILDAHSPDECIEIDTVEKWWLFLTELLKAIPEK
jgi:dipeptidase D